MSGLLINGTLFDVPGVAEVLSPGEKPWVRMESKDYRKRTGAIQMITIHTTQGIDPVKVVPGKGPDGRDKKTADYWSTNGEAGGTPLIVDTDGSIANLIDLVKYEAFHATKVNPYSVGIEMVQMADGTVYQATLDSTLLLVLRLCDLLGIPFQTTSRIYRTNTIIERLRYGGANDVVGVFGHRDNAWKFPEWLKPEARIKYPNGYADRGRGDPGDEIYAMMRRRGAMMFDFDARQDLAYWKAIQVRLNASYNAGLTVSGVCDQTTVAVLRAQGLWNGGVFLESPVP